MRIRTRITAVAAAASLASLGFVGTAYAQGSPEGAPCPTTGTAAGTGTTNGGNCDVSGTITIPTTLAIEMTNTAFTLTPADTSEPLIGSPAPAAQGSGYVYVDSSDVSGYAIDEQSTDYTGPGSAVIPASEVQTNGWGGCQGPFTEGTGGSTPCTYFSATHVSGSNTPGTPPPNIPSGWDGFVDPGYALTTATPTLANGTTAASSGVYDGTVVWSLWGN